MNNKSGAAIKQLNTAALNHQPGDIDALYAAVLQATNGLDHDEMQDVVLYFVGRITDVMHVYRQHAAKQEREA